MMMRRHDLVPPPSCGCDLRTARGGAPENGVKIWRNLLFNGGARSSAGDIAMRTEGSHAAYRFDRYVLDLTRGALLTAEGTAIPLRPKSFTLLRLLVENPGR